VARVPDLSKACAERGLKHGGWVIGAQLKPGAEPRMLIVRCIVGELDAEMPSARKADNEPTLLLAEFGASRRAAGPAPSGMADGRNQPPGTSRICDEMPPRGISLASRAG
jgi:hypothetical protein